MSVCGVCVHEKAGSNMVGWPELSVPELSSPARGNDVEEIERLPMDPSGEPSMTVHSASSVSMPYVCSPFKRIVVGRFETTPSDIAMSADKDGRCVLLPFDLGLPAREEGL